MWKTDASSEVGGNDRVDTNNYLCQKSKLRPRRLLESIGDGPSASTPFGGMAFPGKITRGASHLSYRSLPQWLAKPAEFPRPSMLVRYSRSV
jgi:hypothetical protein